MNDHNLDDLIIDNINPKNSKTKSLLTILALAIVVLVVAIVLTKTLLKEPNSPLAINEEKSTEMISPDLTLQNAIKEEVTIEEEQLSLKPINPSKPKLDEKMKTVSKIETEKVVTKEANRAEKKEAQKESEEALEKNIIETKPKTVVISQDIFDDEADTNTEAEAKKHAQIKKEAQKKKLAAQKKAKQKVLATKKRKQAEARKKKKEKQANKKKKISINQESTNQKNGRYYIQVGSFRQSPSKQFLSIIKKSGFNYRITSPSSSGTKKLLIGPYANRTAANTSLSRVRDRINKSAFVVKK